MKKCFLHIFRFFEGHPLIMWIALVALTSLCAIGALRLDFVEDIGSFLPNSSSNERINYAYQHLGGDNKIVVSFAMSDTTQEVDDETLANAIDIFAEKLAAKDSSHNIKQLLATIDESQIEEVADFVVQNMPYFLTEADYQRMEGLMSDECIAQQVENDKMLLSAPSPMIRKMVQNDPMFFSSNILQSLNSFRLDENYEVRDGYLFNGKEAIVVVASRYPLSETLHNGELLRDIDAAVAETGEETGNSVKISSFGASQVSLTNSQQIKRDSFLAIALSLMLILAILIYYYRNFRSIALIFVSVLFGGIFALGCISLFRNPVSVIAIGVASIIIGIAINYPIHVLSHFKRTNDKMLIIKEVATPLLIGNITTVGAFISLLFISSDAMKDLGLFAALLLIGTMLFVLVFLPQMMGKRFQSKHRELAFRRIAELRTENVKGLFLVIVCITIALWFFSSRTGFDTNMHHINYMTPEQQAQFDKLRAQADTTCQTIYCIAEGTTLDEALKYNEIATAAIEKLEADSTICKAAGIRHFLPSKEVQAERIARWNSFWEAHREAFCRSLDQAAANNGFTSVAFNPCKEIISREYSVQEIGYFDIIKSNLAENYIAQDSNKTLVYNMLTVKKENTQSVENQLNNINGSVFSFTDNSIASRLVDALSHDFDYVLYICGLIVFAFLLYTFGSLEISLMAFLPLFTAWIWILGIMGITGTQFNIVNIILATFIFGMGDDYAIFVTEGLIHEHTYGKKMLSQFKNSIILSASIMFIGIGMLVFAKHPAMRSLAVVTIIGMFSVVLMAYVVPPAIFKWLTTKKGKLRNHPVTFATLFSTFVSFSIFISWVTCLQIGGFFLMTFGGRTPKNKLRFHTWVYRALKYASYCIPRVKYQIRNPHNEDFQKPAIIICNHQSLFDMVYTLSLSPKIVCVTNKRIFNHPLYRLLARYSGYVQTDDNVEENLEQVREVIAQGYSLLVFPEGTRSENCDILRFHKGAFHLAEQLQIDIIPLIQHGIGHALPKHDIIIGKGFVTMDIEARITPENAEFRNGTDLSTMTHKMRHYYQQRYKEISLEKENADYFKEAVRENYLYKGKEVMAHCRKQLKKSQQLDAFLCRIPQEGTLLVKNCGIGALSLLTALIKKEMQVTAYDADEDFVIIAQNCKRVPANLCYTSQLPDEKDFDIVLDVNEL